LDRNFASGYNPKVPRTPNDNDLTIKPLSQSIPFKFGIIDLNHLNQ
jgi:hypothetical protein